jgi:hypothetical protein
MSRFQDHLPQHIIDEFEKMQHTASAEDDGEVSPEESVHVESDEGQ